MHARSTRPSGRARFAALTAAAALAVGTALLGTTSPAYAAAPTLNQPTPPVGWTWVTLTGTADPGATVQLFEAAYAFRDDMYPAVQFFPEDIISAVADSSGRYTLRRRMDSGFRFKVQADGVDSNHVDVPIVANPSMQLSVSGNDVSVSVVSEPGQPGLPVAIQRQSGTGWTALAEGSTGEGGVYSAVLTSQPAGMQYYRAAVGPESPNLVSLGHSVTIAVDIGGTGTPIVIPTTPAPTTPAPTTPAPTTPAPTTPVPTTPAPTTPAPKPTTPKPTTPKPVVTQRGDVQFSLVQYNAPGKDTSSAKSLNGEYWRITNKTKRTIYLKNWTVKDRAGNTYRFPTLTLAGGRSVTVATGKGVNGKPAGWRYWGRGGHVLNNTGDGLWLRTATGKVIDACGWGNGNGRTTC